MKKLCLLLLLLNLIAGVVFPMIVSFDGFADGEIAAINGNFAILVTNASQKSGEAKSRLIAVEVNNKKILWESDCLGPYLQTVFVNDQHLILLVKDRVVCREFFTGKVVWQISLLNVSTTDKDDLFPEMVDKASNKKKHVLNKCITQPDKAIRFDYHSLVIGQTDLLLFRVLKQTHESGGPLSLERDLLKINRQSGEVIGKGCYRLLGLTKESAVISDYHTFSRISKKGFEPLHQSNPIHEIFSDTLLDSFIKAEYSSAEWFFIPKDITGDRDKQLVTYIPQNEKYVEVSITAENGYSSDVVAVGSHILHFPSFPNPKILPKDKRGEFWLETYNLAGQSVKRKVEKLDRAFPVSYLGQMKDNSILLSAGKEARRYSVPDLKLISIIKIDERKPLHKSNNSVVISDSLDFPLLAYAKGGKMTNMMKTEKETKTLFFKFFDLKTGNKVWRLKRKVTYFKKKRKKYKFKH